MPQNIKKYNKDQYQECMKVTGLSLSSVKHYVSQEGFDPTDSNIFKAQHDEYLANSRNQPKVVDEDEVALKMRKLKATTEKEEALAELNRLKVDKEEGSVIAISEVEEFYDRFGITLKTILEAVGKDISASIEGKKSKEIKIILDAKMEMVLDQLANLSLNDDD